MSNASASDRAPAICCEGVSLYAGPLTILDQISCRIHCGERIGIIGPNGGGKTTLLKVMMGLLRPDRGRSLIGGREASLRPLQIGYVPQSLPFDRSFPLSLKAFVLTGLLAQTPWHSHYTKAQRKAVEEEIARVGLEKKIQRPLGALSGGELQRALIARALVSKPSLLMLDEPTASIDPEAQQMIYALLRSLPRTLTILMVTHDLQAALQEVDRLLCVQKTLIQLTPEEACAHYTMGLYHRPLLKPTTSAQ